MDKCPAELVMRIMKLACTDEGSTGRSLSLVSRYIREASREFKLQNLAIVGKDQIISCVAMLEATPARYRRVRHLYLTNLQQHDQPQAEPTRIWEDPQKSVSSGTHYEPSCLAFAQILTLVAPTLVTFYLCTNISRVNALLPITLPHLVDLTIYGPFPPFIDHSMPTAVFPSLRNLEFINFQDYPGDVFEDIGVAAPELTHLTFRPAMAHRYLHNDIADALDPDSPTMMTGLPALPQTLQVVAVQPGRKPKTEHGQWVRSVYTSMLKKLLYLAQHDRRIEVLKPDPIVDYHETRVQWVTLRNAAGSHL